MFFIVRQCNISIHAPREGSDLLFWWYYTTLSYFYPRSPRGERPPVPVLPFFVQDISIHAPREGSDPLSRKKVGLLR